MESAPGAARRTGDGDFGTAAEMDLDATKERGKAIFANYRFDPIEDLLA